MARLIFPEAFDQVRELQRLIRAKHVADGGTSVLIPILTEKAINLDVDLNTMTDANGHNVLAKKFERESENHVQTRNLRFDVVMAHTRSEVQFLKAFYKPNVQALGDWGVPVDNGKKINYPPQFTELVKIVRAIKVKHESYAGATSPLTPFLTEQGININTDATNTTLAEADETSHLDSDRDAEEETQLRITLSNAVITNMHTIADYLMKLFKGKEKKLGEWGFMVDDSPKAPKLQKVTVLPSETKTTAGIVIGGTLTNTGTVSIKVYKGKTATGDFTTVAPNDKLGMIKGFSAITTVNTSTLVKATFTVLVSR